MDLLSHPRKVLSMNMIVYVLSGILLVKGKANPSVVQGYGANRNRQVYDIDLLLYLY
jgi:hypothetical protein